MNWLDTKYINLVSSRLPLFKKRAGAWNFRCPFCGDSAKKKFKARGYIYEKKGKANFYCHNCGTSLSFDRFLEKIDPTHLHAEYVREKILEKMEARPFGDPEPRKTTPVAVSSVNVGLASIASLPLDHPARRYVTGRFIPQDKFDLLYYAPQFKAYVDKHCPGKFDWGSSFDEPRLVIPLLDKDKKMFGFQGRSFDPNASVRYITIMLDEESPNLFGLDRVDLSKRVYVLEGPIDSLFIENALASTGNLLYKDLPRVGVSKENSILVYDNERRSPTTVSKIEKAIDKGYTVTIWPEWITEKDVAKMVENGWIPDSIRILINQHSHSGLAARLALQAWRKN